MIIITTIDIAKMLNMKVMVILMVILFTKGIHFSDYSCILILWYKNRIDSV